MSYFNKHLRASNVENIQNIKNNINPYYANKFKKSVQNKSKLIEASNAEDTYRIARHNDQENIVRQYRKDDAKPNAKPPLPKEPRYKVGQFITQNPNSHSDSMSRQLQNLMMDTDNSMEELLNSSINQFTRYLQDKDNFYEQHNQLIQQNNYLKASLDQLKTILKQKLQNALKKQKDELTLMMQDYIKLITKLLKDKEQLTTNLQQMQKQSKQQHTIIDSLQRSQREGRNKVNELTKERECHIANTKKQIDDFLKIIYQYQEETEQEGEEARLMKATIEELEMRVLHYEAGGHLQSKQQLNKSISAKNSKIQALIALLQRSQQENSILKESLHKISQSNDQAGQIEEQYKLRLQEIERQHEEEFIQFEKAVRETINKKDECIERLNRIIEGYRIKRHDLQNSMKLSEGSH